MAGNIRVHDYVGTGDYTEPGFSGYYGDLRFLYIMYGAFVYGKFR